MASYTVSSGDSLSAIARRYNTTVAALLAANPKLTSDPKYKGGKTIFSGTKLTLPDTNTVDGSSGEVFINDTRVVAPPVTQPTVTAPPVNPFTVAPSTIASGESGAIGAASIAAQLAAIEKAKQTATQQAAQAAQAAEKARVQAQMAAEEAAIEAERKAAYDNLIKSGYTPEQAGSQLTTTSVQNGVTTVTNYDPNAIPATTVTPTSTPTPTPTSTPTTTPTTTSTTPVDYTGQIATRYEENGKVVYRLPDGTIVNETAGPDGYIYYMLPNGTKVKSGKLATAEVISSGAGTPSAQYYTNPTTGEQILGPDGKPIVIGPGGSATDVFSYTEALRAATDAKQRAALANTFSRRQAQTELEKSQRTTGRDIYSQQQKALNELAKRGITSAPGLQTAARRAAGAVPLAKRLDALQQYQQSMTATDLMLAGEQAKADETQRQALVKLTQASNIANRLSGGA